MHRSLPHSIRGFTLIELMVVIVIIGIMASLVLMNIGGVDQRRAMQAREVFLMDLQKISREANDQARILALRTQSASDVANFNYSIQEYFSAHQQQQQQGFFEQNKKWQAYPEFETRVLPDHVSLQIQALDQNYTNAQNKDLINHDAPKLIWLGNGEVKPVRIQFFLDDRAVGEEINIDHLGKINES